MRTTCPAHVILLDLITAYLRTKFHTPSSDVTLVIRVKPKAKCRVRKAAMLLFHIVLKYPVLSTAYSIPPKKFALSLFWHY